MIIDGAISIKAALESKTRHVFEVYLLKGKKSKDFDYIERLCQKNAVPFKVVDQTVMEAFVTSKNFGGIVAEVGERRYQTLEDLRSVEDVLLIEGVEDPFNLGQMIRTAYASGTQAVLLNDRDWSKVESVLLRSSAGAFDRIKLVLMKDIQQDLLELKSQGFTLISALRKADSINYLNFQFPKRFILAIGGEMRGLSRAVSDHSDVALQIFYPNQSKVALSAVSACAILSFSKVQKP